MNLVALLHLIVSFVVIVLAVPLILRKIPMNNWYGVRVPAAFESDDNWYRINARGGWIMLAWGVAVAVIASVGLLVERRYWMHYTWASLVMILGSLGLAAALILRSANDVPAAGGDVRDSAFR